MVFEVKTLSRVFKTAWFAKAAKKANISDKELRRAILQVMQGQADDLGGGVFKKRLKENSHRCIIIAKGGRYWIYSYLFAKKDRDNIDEDELKQFRKIAASNALKSESDIETEIRNGDLEEVFL